MSNVLIEEKTMTDIANVIREKSGTVEKIKPAEMPKTIREIASGNPYQILQDKFFYSGRISFSYAFHYSKITYDDLINLALDTSRVTSFSNMFAYCNSLTTIPQLDTSGGKNFSFMFHDCHELTTIPQLDISKGIDFYGMFSYCRLLKNISFVANCIKKSISFLQSSLLTDESIQSIIDGLADLTGQTAQTITFHPDVKNKLTEEQIASATSKNWNIA